MLSDNSRTCGSGVFIIWPFALFAVILLVIAVICATGWALTAHKLAVARAELVPMQDELGLKKIDLDNVCLRLDEICNLKVRVVALPASYMYFGGGGEIEINLPSTIVEFPVEALSLGELLPRSSAIDPSVIVVPIDLSIYRFGGAEDDWRLWDDIDPLVAVVRENAAVAASMRNSEGFVDY